MWICIALHHEDTSKALRYGTRSQAISQFYLHTPHSSANGVNHTCLFLPSGSWSSFTDPGRMEGWFDLGGWLHAKINVRRRELNPDMVIHPSADFAQHSITSLIETNTLPLCQTAIDNPLTIQRFKHYETFDWCADTEFDIHWLYLVDCYRIGSCPWTG